MLLSVNNTKHYFRKIKFRVSNKKGPEKGPEEKATTTAALQTHAITGEKRYVST